jgi:hypothetical protein
MYHQKGFGLSGIGTTNESAHPLIKSKVSFQAGDAQQAVAVTAAALLTQLRRNKEAA